MHAQDRKSTVCTSRVYKNVSLSLCKHEKHLSFLLENNNNAKQTNLEQMLKLSSKMYTWLICKRKSIMILFAQANCKRKQIDQSPHAFYCVSFITSHRKCTYRLCVSPNFHGEILSQLHCGFKGCKLSLIYKKDTYVCFNEANDSIVNEGNTSSINKVKQRSLS